MPLPDALPGPVARSMPPWQVRSRTISILSRGWLCAWLCAATLCLAGGRSVQEDERIAAMPSGDAGTAIDPARTEIGFALRTRWGQTLRGRFRDFDGRVEALADGRRRVHLRLSSRTVVIEDHPNYTRYTRGEGFFDAERYPEVSFVSAPYDPAMLRSGGKLSGMLRIRDVQRSETFEIAAAECVRPGHDCDVVAVGSVRRSDYGVDRWMFAVADAVRFTLRLRLRDQPTGEGP